jgi:hypothetical protein
MDLSENGRNFKGAERGGKGREIKVLRPEPETPKAADPEGLGSRIRSDSPEPSTMLSPNMDNTAKDKCIEIPLESSSGPSSDRYVTMALSLRVAKATDLFK